MVITAVTLTIRATDAGWSSSVARWAHNPEVVGSNPAPATSKKSTKGSSREGPFCIPQTLSGIVVTNSCVDGLNFKKVCGAMFESEGVKVEAQRG